MSKKKVKEILMSLGLGLGLSGALSFVAPFRGVAEAAAGQTLNGSLSSNDYQYLDANGKATTKGNEVVAANDGNRVHVSTVNDNAGWTTINNGSSTGVQLTVTGGTWLNVVGGFNNKDENCTYNMVTIGGTAVITGYVQAVLSLKTKRASDSVCYTNNTVNIVGGTIQGNVRALPLINGESSNNVIYWSGGTICGKSITGDEIIITGKDATFSGTSTNLNAGSKYVRLGDEAASTLTIAAGTMKIANGLDYVDDSTISIGSGATFYIGTEGKEWRLDGKQYRWYKGGENEDSGNKFYSSAKALTLNGYTVEGKEEAGYVNNIITIGHEDSVLTLKGNLTINQIRGIGTVTVADGCTVNTTLTTWDDEVLIGATLNDNGTLTGGTEVTPTGTLRVNNNGTVAKSGTGDYATANTVVADAGNISIEVTGGSLSATATGTKTATAAGAYVSNGGTITLKNVTGISGEAKDGTTSNVAYGIDNEGSGIVTITNDASVVTTISATATTTGGTVKAYGIMAKEKTDLETATPAVVTISGGTTSITASAITDEAYGVYAQDATNVTLSVKDITASGTKAYGVYANGSSANNVSNVAITLGGILSATGSAESYGVYAGANSNVGITGGTVTVSGGTTSYGLYANGGTITATNVQTITGAVYAEGGTVSITGSSAENKTEITGSVMAKNSGTTVNLKNVEVTGNVAEENSGTISFAGSVSITGNLTVNALDLKKGNTLSLEGSTYVLTTGGTNAGTLKLTGGTLGGNNGNTLTNSGTINVTGEGKTVIIPSNKLAISGGGVTVDSGSTLDIKSANKLVGNVAITNSGTVKLNGGTLSGGAITGGTVAINNNTYLTTGELLGGDMTLTITNNKSLTVKDGTLTVGIGTNTVNGKKGNLKINSSGVVTAQKAVYTKIKTEGGTLAIDADNVLNTVDNSSVLSLTGGTLGNTVGGSGIVYVDNVSADASMFVSTLAGVSVNADKTLKLTGGILSAKVNGEGTLSIAGDVTAAAGNIAAATNTVANGQKLTLTAGTLTKAVSGAGTLKIAGAVSANADYVTATTNTVESGKTLTLTAGTLTKAVSGAGTLKIAGAVSANADYVTATTNTVESGKTLTLTDGTLTKAVSGEGTLKIDGAVSANAGYITATTNTVESGKTLTLTAGTLTKAVSGAGTLKIGGNVSTDAGYVTATTNTVESGKTLTLTGGTLANSITGDGTTDIAGTVNVNSNISVSNLTSTNGTIDMKDGTADTFTVTILGGTVNLGIDVLSSSSNDILSISNVSGTPTINIASVKAGSELSTSGGTITFMSGTYSGSDITYWVNGGIAGEVIASYGDYDYTFKNGTNAGTLTYTAKLSDTKYVEFVSGVKTKTNDTFTLSSDVTNLGGTGVVVQGGTANELTTKLEGHALGETNANLTVVVGAGKTMNINGGSSATAGTVNTNWNLTGGSLNFSGNVNLNGSVTGNGAITNTGTLTFSKTLVANNLTTTEGTLVGAGGTLDMANGTVDASALTIGTLGGSMNLAIDVNLGSTSTSDKLEISAASDTPTINVSAVNVVADTSSGTIGDVTYATGSGVSFAGGTTYTATNVAIYTFEKSATAGTMTVSKNTQSVAFKNFIEGTIGGGSVDPSTLSLTGTMEEVESADVTADTQSNSALTIYLNGHDLGTVTGGSIPNVIVGAKTMNLKNGSTNESVVYTGWSIAEDGTLAVDGKIAIKGEVTGGIAGTFTNSGTLSMSAGGIKHDLTNYGIVNVEGAPSSYESVNLDAVITGGAVNITNQVTADVAKLQTTGGITNAGTLTLTGGNADVAAALADNISGAGTTVIAGYISSAKNIANAVTVNADASLTNGGTISGTVVINDKGSGTAAGSLTNTGTIIGNVTNSGTLTSSGTISGTIANTGTLNLNSVYTNDNAIGNGAGGVINVSADNLKAAVTNAVDTATVNLGGGTLTVGVSGGVLNIIGDVTSVAANIAGTTNAIVSGKTLTLTGNSNLNGVVSDAGKVVIDGTISANAGNFTQTGGLEIKDADDSLTLTGNSVDLGVAVSGAGKVIIGGLVSANAGNFAQTGGLEINDAAYTLTLTGENQVLGVAVSGAGNVAIDGTVSASADKFTQTGNLEVASGKTLTLTGGSLTKAVTGAGSIVIDGAVSAAAGNFGSTISSLSIKDADDVLTLSGTLSKAVTGSGTIAVVKDTTLTTANAANLGVAVDNEGTVELSGGTLEAKVTGGLLNITGDVAAAAGNIAGDTNHVADSAILTLKEGTMAESITTTEGYRGTVAISGIVDTGDNTIANVLVINSGGTLKLNSEYDNTTAITNAGTLEVSATNLQTAVTNSKDTTNGTVKVTGTTTEIGGTTIYNDNLDAIITGGNVELKDVNFVGSSLEKVNKLTLDNAQYSFTFDIGTAMVGTNDVIGMATSDGTVGGSLVFGDISLTGTRDDAWEINVTKDVSIVSNTVTGTFTIAKEVIATNKNTYTFKQSSVAGCISVTKGKSTDLKDIVTDPEGVGTFTLEDDYVAENDLGTLKSTDDAGRTLTIEGTKKEPDTENYDYIGNNHEGMTLANENDVLNLKNLNSIATWKDNVGVVTNNSGIVNISTDATTTLSSYLRGAGQYNLTGGTLAVTDAKYLAMTGTNGINNSGTINLQGGTLGSKITGGVLNINADVTAAANYIAGTTNTVATDKVLTLTEGTLAKAVTITNNGTVALDSKAVLAGSVTGGTLEVTGTGTELQYATVNSNIVFNEGSDMSITGGTTGAVNVVTMDGITITGKDDNDAESVQGTLTVASNNKLVFNNDTEKTIMTDVVIETDAVMDPVVSVFAEGVNVYVEYDENEGTTGGNLILQPGTLFATIHQEAGSVIQTKAASIDSGTGAAPVTTNGTLFAGVTDADQLDISAGTLKFSDATEKWHFYKVVSGSAVENGTLTESQLWALENIQDNFESDDETQTNQLHALAQAGCLLPEYYTKGDIIAVEIRNIASAVEKNTSALAGVQQGAISIVGQVADVIGTNLAMRNRPAAEGKYDKTVWASYINSKDTTEGMDLGGSFDGNNTLNYHGVTVGADLYTSAKVVTGLALTYATGNVTGTTLNTHLNNKTKYYGVSLYDRVTNGDTALTYDLGYSHGKNEITQCACEEVTADAKTDAFTAGVKAEQVFNFKHSTLAPFAAFRYVRLQNKDYSNSNGAKFETDNQNLFMPKVGLTWNGKYEMPKCDWNFQPKAEVGYLWNLGDRDVQGSMKMNTRNFNMDYDTADRGTYYAELELTFNRKNFTGGVGYHYAKGDSVRHNRWNINMSWSF